jgi:hypothetical protein
LSRNPRATFGRTRIYTERREWSPRWRNFVLKLDLQNEKLYRLFEWEIFNILDGEEEPEIPPSSLLGNNYESRMMLMVKNISHSFDEFKRLYEHTDFLEVIEQTAINNAMAFSAKYSQKQEKEEQWQ